MLAKNNHLTPFQSCTPVNIPFMYIKFLLLCQHAFFVAAAADVHFSEMVRTYDETNMSVL
jgi:hypothetical protein